MSYLLAWGMPGPTDWIIIGIIALLIFGKRLPEVGRSLGRGIVEFKKGLQGVQDELTGDQANSAKQDLPGLPMQSQLNSSNAAAAPKQQYKFDPYTGKPLTPLFDPYTGQRLQPENTVSTNQTQTEQPEHSQT